MIYLFRTMASTYKGIYQMCFDITFITESKRYKLLTVDEVEINKSVDTLADTAVITLPEYILNRVMEIENYIGRGSQVIIYLGYNGDLKEEFRGWVERLSVNDHSVKIMCEDDLFIFRKSVKNMELKPTNMKKIAQQLTAQIDGGYTVNCDFDISYEKFVIHNATAYDVLNKLAEETKANIWLDTKNKVLHIHPPYLEKGGDVIYSMQRNIESSNLEYKQAIDKKVEVTVESIDKAGKVIQKKVGTSGGDSVTLKVGNISEASLDKIANAELIKRTYDGYDGDFDAWLIPYVEPSWSAKIIDEDYPDKTGKYYVVSVKTSFSSSGGKRTVTLGIKVS